MKRLLSLFLVIVMLASLLISCGKKNKKDDLADNPSDAVTDPSEEANPEAGLTVTPTDMILSVGEKRKLSTNYIPKYTSDSTVLTFKTSDSAIAGVDTDGTVVAIKSGTATITVKDAKGDFTATCLVTVLGTSTTLQGSIHLPPIDSQGSLGTCAHESVTYAQFTIAVSQYINSKAPDSGWNPSSGELRYIFSPKFTYNFAAAGTEYAYNILVDHGCLTEEHSRFYHVGDATTSGPATAPYKETASWDVGKGLTELALNYRLTGYEEIDYTGAHSGNLTTGSEASMKLFNRVKAAVTDGNAVVICGWSSYWEYGSLSKSGDIGKKGAGFLLLFIGVYLTQNLGFSAAVEIFCFSVNSQGLLPEAVFSAGHGRATFLLICKITR